MKDVNRAKLYIVSCNGHDVVFTARSQADKYLCGLFDTILPNNTRKDVSLRMQFVEDRFVPERPSNCDYAIDGDYIRLLRTKNRLTFRELAAATGLTPTAFWKIENHKCDVGLAIAKILSDIFDVPMDDLLYREGRSYE